MSDVKTIAKLVAHLGFTVDDKQLDAFVSKLNVATAALKKMREEARSDIKFKFSVNKTDLIQSKKTLATLGDVKIRLKDIEPSLAKMANVRKVIADSVGKAQVRLTDISLSDAATKKIRQDIKAAIKVGGVTVPAKIDTKEISKQLREWIKTRQKAFTFRLQVAINQHNLYTNLKQAVDNAASKVKTINLKDPNIKVGIDKQHLTKEIRAALAQIKREVRLKIDLTAHGSLSGGGSGLGSRVGGGGFGSRHGALAGGVAGMAASWGRGFIPGLGGAFAVSHLNRQVQEFEAQQQAASAVSGSQQAGGATLDRLRTMGNEIGFDYRSQAMPFLRMIASGTNAGMGQGEVETIFSNMAKYGRVMGLDDESMKGSMRAVEQMLNKQQVYSEELKTQLAERMPGVISAMAEAVTGDANDTATLFEKMEKGEVKSTEVMLKFSQILERRAMVGGALQRAMQSTAAEQARFRNAWNDWVKEFGEGGFSEAMATFFREAALTLSELSDSAGNAAKAFRVLLTPIIAIMRIVRNLDFGKIAASLGLTTGELQTMAAVVGGLLFPWTRLLTIIGLVVTTLDDLMTWSRGGESIFGRIFEGLSPERQAALLGVGESLKNLVISVGNLFSAVGDRGGQFWNWLDDNGLVDKAIGLLDNLIQRIEKVINTVTQFINDPLSFSASDFITTGLNLTPAGKLMSLFSSEDDSQSKPKLRKLPDGSYEFLGESESDSRREALKKGLESMKEKGVGYDGRRGVATVEGTSVEIKFHMTADDIVKAVGDGSLPKVIEGAVKKATNDWMVKELGATAARLNDYGE